MKEEEKIQLCLSCGLDHSGPCIQTRSYTEQQRGNEQLPCPFCQLRHVGSCPNCEVCDGPHKTGDCPAWNMF